MWMRVYFPHLPSQIILKIFYYKNRFHSIELMFWCWGYLETEILILLMWIFILFKCITFMWKKATPSNSRNYSLTFPIPFRHDCFKIDYSLVCHHLLSIFSQLYYSSHIFAYVVQNTEKLSQVIKNHIAKTVGFFLNNSNLVTKLWKTSVWVKGWKNDIRKTL